jgi:hypothetical protein
MNQLMNLITELVKMDIQFTVRPLGEQIEVTAFYHISVMDNITEIRHPIVMDDKVHHSSYFIRGNDESDDGIQYKWTFGPIPVGAWDWEMKNH